MRDKVILIMDGHNVRIIYMIRTQYLKLLCLINYPELLYYSYIL